VLSSHLLGPYWAARTGTVTLLLSPDYSAQSSVLSTVLSARCLLLPSYPTGHLVHLLPPLFFVPHSGPGTALCTMHYAADPAPAPGFKVSDQRGVQAPETFPANR
jgi:hypothetical protein